MKAIVHFYLAAAVLLFASSDALFAWGQKGHDVTCAIARKHLSPRAEKAVLALRMLIHFTADLHCPMHVGHKSDKGGNKWQIQFFGNGTNLHAIWDTGILERGHNWTYSEWRDEIDNCTKKEISEIVKGTPYDWGKETFALAAEIYHSTPVGSKLSYDYVAKWTPVIERQLLIGGLRLASILNDIF